MPYIKKNKRDEMKGLINALSDQIGGMPGNLNYVITKLVLNSMPQKPTYFNYNEMVGVLECAKQEFYRRAAVPYEKNKIDENGDVY